MSSSENSSERLALDINLWQPWGDFFFNFPSNSCVIKRSSGHLMWHIFLMSYKKVTAQPRASGADGVLAISRAHNRAHWGLPAIASHVLWTEGRHISVNSPSRPVLLFLLCFYKETNMFNPSWTLRGWNSSSLQWALCVREWISGWCH